MTFRMLGFFFFSSSSSSSFSSSEIRNEFVQWAGMEICHTVHVPLLSVGWPTGDFFFGWTPLFSLAGCPIGGVGLLQ